MFYKNQQGVTIYIAILILSLIIVLAVSISEIVLRTSNAAKKIGLSETAYFAAESAVEKAVYAIEKERTIGGLDSSGSLETITGVVWTRDVSEITNFSTLCSGLGENQGVCVDNEGEITDLNPLKIKLSPGSSFQLDINFFEMSLPAAISITWNGTAKAVALGAYGQETSESSPLNLIDLSTNLYTIRIINEDSSLLTFQITPSGASLPIGILISATGNYKEQQRSLEIERANWQIY